MKQYIYSPIGWDYCDPRIVAGEQIEAGAVVSVVKSNYDPANYFRLIEDKNGNRQSVSYRSLKSLK